jgi:hypothetical protein
MLVLRIADVENCTRFVIILTTTVDFKLNSHKQIALAVEDWRGLIAVIFDRRIVAVVVAGAAIGIVRVLFIVGVVKIYDTTAVFAGGVVIVVAVTAEIVSAVAFGIVAPNAPSAMTADHRVVAEAICAKCLTAEFVRIFLVERCSADRADFGFVHNRFLRVFGFVILFGLHREDNI